MKNVCVFSARAEDGLRSKLGNDAWISEQALETLRQECHGRIAIMGRVSYEQLRHRGKLPVQEKIVVTSRKSYAAPEAIAVASTLRAAIKLAAGKSVVVIGGPKLCAEARELAAFITQVSVRELAQGSDLFPEVDVNALCSERGGWKKELHIFSTKRPHPAFEVRKFRFVGVPTVH